MCECDGLCKLTREELIAVLQVRLQRLPPKQIVNLLAVVDEWRFKETKAQSEQRYHQPLESAPQSDKPCETCEHPE